MTIRILIADDHGVLRAGLRALLTAEPGMTVVGEAANGEEALDFATQLEPDLVLLDITMPGPSGLEITKQLKETLPSARVLILTVHEDVSLLRAGLQAGASGYIVKRAVDVDLIHAIRAVARGEMYVHSSLAQPLLQNLSMPPAARNPTESFSVREMDVLRLLAKGYTNRQMAQELHLSVRTIETHRSTLMSKSGARNRAELLKYANEHRLLS